MTHPEHQSGQSDLVQTRGEQGEERVRQRLDNARADSSRTGGSVLPGGVAGGSGSTSNTNPEQMQKDQVAMDIADKYGVIIPLQIRLGATLSRLRDIRGILFDAQARYSELYGSSGIVPITQSPKIPQSHKTRNRPVESIAPIDGYGGEEVRASQSYPQDRGPSLVTYHKPRVPLA